MNTMDKMEEAMQNVMKLTVYMTPQQWDRFSAWSAPLVVGHAEGHGSPPWLHLEHEIVQTKEYTDAVSYHHKRLQEHGIITRPITIQEKNVLMRL